PMPMPPFGTYPAVPPPPPPLDSRIYVVELKVMESCPGEEEKLVAQPQLMVVAGQPASLCCPVVENPSCCSSSGEPQGMIGEQGVDVRVIPAGHHGPVLLDLMVHNVNHATKPGNSSA